VVDVEELPTHGGSLRVHVRHLPEARSSGPRVEALLAAEQAAGLSRRDRYDEFAEEVRETKRALLDFLVSVKRKGQSIVGYGAPAKGNTLLNYCGITPRHVAYTVDRSPLKVGRYTPGAHLPVLETATLLERQPDYVLILAWNFAEEILRQQAEYRRRGGRFIIPIPTPQVIE
jgi:hypothetical protein